MEAQRHVAEDATSPHSPLLTAYEAGRWYALHGRRVPCGATAECERGYWDELVKRAEGDNPRA